MIRRSHKMCKPCTGCIHIKEVAINKAEQCQNDMDELFFIVESNAIKILAQRKKENGQYKKDLLKLQDEKFKLEYDLAMQEGRAKVLLNTIQQLERTIREERAERDSKRARITPPVMPESEYIICDSDTDIEEYGARS